ncbi:PEP-CTERM sorting domain-containing protein [Erythrobacter litoralis]|uniref:PEPxxWA-CTERM sorting domain-containing protein n=1 Tax=Erythrobacter litoralis TaxID=39960 RepID=UPI0024360038|nr:PEPxxWA-CTERM sorting domain-containing protein [Erythrobacter litoralis]MDG6079144.1 PEP-CTERM sorting domain-containing protein [Erythrobacter litoralis]
MRYINSLAVSTAAALAVIAPATANAVTVLDFEGIGDQQPVGDFYAPDFVFSPDTLAIIDQDAGGTGNFANEPSASTVMFFLNSNNAVLNALNGFDTGFSFFYSSSTAATVNIWSGLNATGTLLGSINLAAQNTVNCGGDPTGTFCNFTNIGTTFEGTAFSIDFGGTANQTAYDNITFGSATAGGAVPEPATWALFILGFALVGGALRSKRLNRMTTIRYS